MALQELLPDRFLHLAPVERAELSLPRDKSILQRSSSSRRSILCIFLIHDFEGTSEQLPSDAPSFFQPEFSVPRQGTLQESGTGRRNTQTPLDLQPSKIG